MKTTSRLFLFLAAFDAAAAVVYASVSGDEAGITLLFLAAGLHAMIGGYLWVLGRRFQVAPEDRPDAEISDGSGAVGFFSPASVWPFAVGLAASIMLVGLIYTPLTALAGGLILLTAVVGMVSEYWRRPH